MAKIKRAPNKNYVKTYTVGELISILEKFPRKRKVKYTLGGSVDFGNVTYVSGKSPYGKPFVVIGKLS